MAIIRLDCNLNGGDSVTPNNELFYRIYGDVDNYAAPIHTTGTALTDPNVTVDNDTVIITGVDDQSSSFIKIASVDAAFNEAILSDGYSTQPIPDPDNLWPNQFLVDTNGDGTADDYIKNASANTVATIVAADIGNGQREERILDGAGALSGTATLSSTVEIGQEYRLSFKYRSNKEFQVIASGGATDYVYPTFSANDTSIWTSVEIDHVYTVASTNLKIFLCLYDQGLNGTYREFSELVFKKIS